MKPRWVACAVVAFATSTARADGDTPPGANVPPSPFAPPPQQVIEYSHQTLVADAVAVAFAVGALALKDREVALPMAVLGAELYVAGGPIVHLAHRNWSGAGKSLALRLGLPLFGALGAGLMGPKRVDGCDPGNDCAASRYAAAGIVVATLAGTVGAMVLDAKYLARKRTPAPYIAPWCAYTQAGVSLGVGGAF